MTRTERPRAAPTRLHLLPAWAAALFLCSAPAATAQSLAAKRASARAQYQRAERLRFGLQGMREKDRTVDQYLQVIATYHRVPLITPRASEVPASLVTIADLFREMGRLFEARYYQSAIDTYQRLLREHPQSRYRDTALLAIAEIEKDDLAQPERARKSYQRFVKLHPDSPRVREAKAALVELAEAAKAKPEPESKHAANLKTESVSGGREGKTAQVTQIRSWNAEEYTRVVVELEDSVKYEASRLADPDRIYFDLHKAKLASSLAHKNIDVDVEYLKSIRVAQNQADVVRVVLELDKAREYSAYLLPNPYRLVVDIRAGSSSTAKQTAKAEPPADPQPGSSKPAPSAEKTEAQPDTTEGRPSEKASGKTVNPENSSAKAPVAERGEARAPSAAVDKSARTKSIKATREAAAKLTPPPVPQPTHDGQRSLTRALGLKIGRIVIDPGHGGHDTGTIGPTGLMEKDLCLDVALRLDRIIQQRLPGAEVILTRDDDTFVPLEQRTSIANEHKADLFLSIHANSSRDHGTRGVETYYLNLAATPEAMEVAARENAFAQGSVHDLQDVVRRIARNEKVEESREFASDIQGSLAKRLQRLSRSTKNRGVRKAPFVVLIGANMPSVLSEVSFISNPSDEQLLKKPENRQRVAEGLYQGVERYLGAINSLTYNQPPRTLPTTRTNGVSSNGNQQ